MVGPMSRQTALWALAAIFGLTLAAGISWATSTLTSQHIGLASEPVTAGRRLAPAEATRTAPAATTPHPSEAPRSTPATTGPPPVTTTPPAVTTTAAPEAREPEGREPAIEEGTGSTGGGERRDDSARRPAGGERRDD